MKTTKQIARINKSLELQRRTLANLGKGQQTESTLKAVASTKQNIATLEKMARG